MRLWTVLFLCLFAPTVWAQSPVSSTVPVGTAAQHKIYSPTTTVKTISGIVADVGSATVTASIYGTLLYGSATTIPVNLTLDLTHGKIDCNNVSSAVTFKTTPIAPAQQIFVNCGLTGIVAGASTVGLAGTWVVYPQWWGATADSRVTTVGAITSGDNTLTVSINPFTSADIGKLITVIGAGAAGGVLTTTIASINAANSVETTVAAGTTVSAATVNWGADNSIPLQAALTFTSVANGRLMIPAATSAGRGYMFGTALSVSTASRGFTIDSDPGARLNYAGASGYAFSLVNSFYCDMRLYVDVLTLSANGVAIEQSGSGNSGHNILKGVIRGVDVAAAKPAVGAGSIGVHIKHSLTVAKSNYWNILDGVFSTGFDNTILIDGAAAGGNASNANLIIHPTIEHFWYGIAVLSDENSIIGGYCFIALGIDDASLSHMTECIHLGDAANNIQALYNEIIGMTMEPDTGFPSNTPLVVETGSLDNHIDIMDNTNTPPLINETQNDIATRTLRIQKQTSITPRIASGIGLAINAFTGQTGDLMQVKDINGNINFGLNRFGVPYNRRALMLFTAGTASFDPIKNNYVSLVLTANVTTIDFAATFTPKVGSNLVMQFTQAASGGPYTVAGWPSNVKLAGGAFTMTATAGRVDILTFIYHETDANWYEIGRAQDVH